VRTFVTAVVLVGCNLDSKLPVVPDDATDALDAPDAPVESACDLSKPFGSPTVVAGINMGGSIRMSPQLLTAFFHSEVAGGVGLHDLYTADRATVNDPFGPQTNLTVLNSTSEDLNPTVSGDGLIVVFTSLRSGNFDLHVASRSSSMQPFPSPTRITALATAGLEADPFLREDGTVLYYRTDGDIFRATLGGLGFANPMAVSAINTADDDDSPVVTPDELTIFWASNRPDGGARGNSDIWMATRQTTNEAFSNPQNVTELNTTMAEHPRYVTSDACTLFFDGPGGSFVATRPK
jgi:WD40-like Beta Propeller Repeat